MSTDAFKNPAVVAVTVGSVPERINSGHPPEHGTHASPMASLLCPPGPHTDPEAPTPTVLQTPVSFLVPHGNRLVTHVAHTWGLPHLVPLSSCPSHQM